MPTIPSPDMDEESTDVATELTRAALTIEANSHSRGSRSATYESCTRHFIAVLAKEVVSLSNTYGRPEIKISFAAGKALVALQSAIRELFEDDGENL